MALKHYNPTSPARRGLILIDRSGLFKGRPVKALTEGKTKTGGRNNKGHVTSRGIAGGHKQRYRIVDFKRRLWDVEGTVERIEYDPNRTAFIALINYGDTPEGKAMLVDRSPLYRAAAIERPLLIGQGANDPRVKQAESDQIVAAMQKAGIPVTYVVFPDEGHGFAKPTNNIAFNAVTENFLATCLGGRAEPITGELEASTAEIRAGAEYVKGLAAGG